MRLLPAQLPAVKAKPDEGETQEEHEYQDVIRLGQPSGDRARLGGSGLALAQPCHSIEYAVAVAIFQAEPDAAVGFAGQVHDRVSRWWGNLKQRYRRTVIDGCVRLECGKLVNHPVDLKAALEQVHGYSAFEIYVSKRPRARRARIIRATLHPHLEWPARAAYATWQQCETHPRCRAFLVAFHVAIVTVALGRVIAVVPLSQCRGKPAKFESKL